MLNDDLCVEYYQFGNDNHVIRFGQWNEITIVEVAADGAGDPFAVDYFGLVELYTSDDDQSRLWIDVVNDEGEVVGYQMDLCQPTET